MRKTKKSLPEATKMPTETIPKRRYKYKKTWVDMHRGVIMAEVEAEEPKKVKTKRFK